MTIDGESQPPETLDALLVDEYGADPAFLARLAMLHSSTVFVEARGLDLRDHLCRVFGVDGLVAALEQTKTLAAAAKKTVDAARKPVAGVPDAELAALAEVEARATELIEAADAERAEAERALAEARAANEARLRYDAWKATADRYAAVAAEVAAEVTALIGRDLAVSGPAELEAAEADAVEALDRIRRRRAELAGRAEGIRAGLAELENAEGACPVCRRPLEPGDVEVARAGHERDLAALDADRVPVSETEAMERFEAAVATAAERRAIQAEARRRREAGESARVELEAVTAAFERSATLEAAAVELEAVTAAFERSATLEAAAVALDAARQRILDESVEPLEELLADNWHNLFLDRPGVGLDGDGSVSRRIGSELLHYEQFSDGEKMVTQLLLRILVLRATTRLGFFWVDEPLEHLDPDARRALAVLLAQAPEEPSFPQVLVTTYEEPLIRRLRGSIPRSHLIYVRPSAA